MGRLPNGVQTPRENFEETLDRAGILLSQAMESPVYTAMTSGNYPEINDTLMDALILISECLEDLRDLEDRSWEQLGCGRKPPE